MIKKVSYRELIFNYIMQKYDDKPEFLWKKFPNYAVFRHNENKKWYGIIMDVQKEKLGLDGKEKIDIINVKLDDEFYLGSLIKRCGFSKAFHMNKRKWISVYLDGTVFVDEISKLIDISYQITLSENGLNKRCTKKLNK